MKLKSPAFSIIIISLIAALAILVASALLESAQMATYIIIAVWWIPFSIFAARDTNKRSRDET
ncbi:MAG: hypothetical protein DWQ04_05265 [Chloroflexi bacterium]|nr:MAG: hypothetical protein DWQ04_05265 [Chloroflexota bacterium]